MNINTNNDFNSVLEVGIGICIGNENDLVIGTGTDILSAAPSADLVESILYRT